MRIKLPNPTLLHPITGAPLVPQHFLGKRGQVVTVPAVMGGAPDDGDDGTGGQGAGGTGSGGAGTGTGEGTGSTGGGGTGDSGAEGTGTGEDKVSRKEFDEILNRMKAADQRASKLEEEKKQAERAKLDDTERTKVELNEAKEENSKLQQEINDLRLKLAWSTSAGSVAWYDAEDALAIAERKGVLKEAMDDKGNVDGKKLKAAVETFVKGHQHLVNGSTAGTAGKEEKQPNTVTGVGTKGNKGSNGPEDEVLRRRYRNLQN